MDIFGIFECMKARVEIMEMREEITQKGMPYILLTYFDETATNKFHEISTFLSPECT